MEINVKVRVNCLYSSASMTYTFLLTIICICIPVIPENLCDIINGQYTAHPTSCAHFIQCANGVAEVRPCSPGTLFNGKVCAFPTEEKVDCSRFISCKEMTGGHFRHPTDCRLYIACGTKGKSHIMPCNDGLIWDQQVKTCVPPVTPGECTPHRPQKN